MNVDAIFMTWNVHTSLCLMVQMLNCHDINLFVFIWKLTLLLFSFWMVFCFYSCWSECIKQAPNQTMPSHHSLDCQIFLHVCRLTLIFGNGILWNQCCHLSLVLCEGIFKFCCFSNLSAEKSQVISSLNEGFFWESQCFCWLLYFWIGYYTLFRERIQINNAGSNAYSFKPLSEASDEDLMYATKLSCFVFPSTIHDDVVFSIITWEMLLLQRSRYNKYSWFDDLLPRG